ncbi:MAG: hypothetical protein PHQ62_02815 [Clostridia bacterium]|nr:hypothetical protein [Clostridia bacterium]
MSLVSFGINTLAAGIGEMIYCIVSLIPKVTYLLSNCFLTVLDIFQLLFRKLAGLDGYYVNGNYQEGDIVYQFLKGTVMGEYPTLTNVFWGLIIFGFILLFLSTIISIIRNEYTAEKDGNSKGKIIGKSFKSIFFFAIVPIVVLFGVYLANVVLVAVDKVTSPSTATSTILKVNLLEKYTKVNDEEGESDSTVQSYVAYNFFGIPVATTTATFSGVVFKASAYNANRVRTTLNQTIESGGINYNGFFGLVQANVANNWNGLFRDDNGSADKVAEYIDQAFCDFVKLKITGSSDNYKLKYDSQYIQDYNLRDFDPFATMQDVVIDSINRYNVELVWYYYDLWQYNFIVAFGAGIVMIVIFINIIIGLMKRIVELFGLFLISAPLVALMPLDDGKGYNKWRESFIKKTLMAYGAVGGMNIFFLIFPYLNEIQFFNILPIDRIISTIIIIVGLVSVKSFIGLIGDFIGAENAEAAGGAIAKDVGGTIAKAGLMTAAAVATGGAGLLAVGKLGARGIKTGYKGGKSLASGIKKAATAKSRFAKAETDHASKETELSDAYNKTKAPDYENEVANNIRSDEAKMAEIDKEAENAFAKEQGFNGSDDMAYSMWKSDDANRAKYQSEKDKYQDTALSAAAKKQAQADRASASNALDTHKTKAPDYYDYTAHPLAAAKAGIKGGASGIGRGIKSGALRAGKGIGDWVDSPMFAPITKSISNLYGMGYDSFKENGLTKGFSDAGGFAKILSTMGNPSGAIDKAKKQEKEIKDAYEKLKSEDAAREKLKKEIEEKLKAQKEKENKWQNIAKK